MSKITTDDIIGRILKGEPLRNFCHTFYDDFVEQNVEFRLNAGVKSVITRRNLGDPCSFCDKLIGVYEYGKHPGNIFVRHDSCRCLVTFTSEKGVVQDSHSKDLFKTQREARIARQERNAKLQKINDDYRRLRNIAKDKGSSFVDATKYYLEKGKILSEEIPPSVGILDPIYVKDIQFSINGKQIVLETLNNEESIAHRLVETFGGYIKRVPKVNFPQNVSTPDYIWYKQKFDNVYERWDLKEVSENGKNTIYNVIKTKKNQADNFVVDISKSRMDIDTAKKQIKNTIFRSSHTRFVKKIILIKNEYIGVFERI